MEARRLAAPLLLGAIAAAVVLSVNPGIPAVPVFFVLFLDGVLFDWLLLRCARLNANLLALKTAIQIAAVSAVLWTITGDAFSSILLASINALAGTILSKKISETAGVEMRVAEAVVFAALGFTQSILASIVIFLVPFCLYSGTLEEALKRMDFGKPDLKEAVVLLLQIFALLLLAGIVLTHFNAADNEKVVEFVKGEGILFFFSAIVLAPIGEELLFRGVLRRKWGVLASSVAFAAMHYAYGSVTELVGAFLIGLLLANYAQKTKSVGTCIIAHFLYNLVAVGAMLFLM